MDVTPLRADEALDLRRYRGKSMRRYLPERERLPEGRVVDRRACFAHDEWAVRRYVARVDVMQRLERAVVPAGSDCCRGNSVSERGR